MPEALRRAFDFSLLWQYKGILLGGLLQNIYIFLGAAALATTLAFVVGVARVSRTAALRRLSTGYAEVSRNAPEYVLLVWVHYVLPVLFSRILATNLNFNPYFSAILALGVIYSGFLSETVRAGIQSIPPGHIEAGMAVGMSRLTIIRRIILPQAVRRMLPESLNQYVSLFKATSIVSVIAIPDLMYEVSMITVSEMRPLPLYTGAALIYCTIIIVAASFVRHLTERWRRRGWT